MPDTNPTLHSLIRCFACGAALSFSPAGVRLCCDGEGGSVLRNGFLIHDPGLGKSPTPEMLVRDSDARHYISHPKFPPQIDRLASFLRTHVSPGDRVLDLGCGPGPTTEMLLRAAADAVAVDFSVPSLALNARLCGALAERALFVQADLNTIQFTDSAFDGLMMADFLQHLGGKKTQRDFLDKSFRALKPGGWFYLSFFNTNMFHRLTRDRSGIRGNIGYRRTSLAEVHTMLPGGIVAENEYVMNICDQAAADRIASRLPFASLLARMAVIEGRRLR
ncbi:MAG: hypothetical protein RJB62_632 [Pseudomonadota bacterium]|jgi:SAM-dependent methyltransferase